MRSITHNGSSSSIFKIFSMLDLGIEPRPSEWEAQMLYRAPYSKSIYGPDMGFYIWPISGPDMEFISGLYKNWADITWYNIKAIYDHIIMAQIKFHFYLAQICSIYGYSISGPYMGNPYMLHIKIFISGRYLCHIWNLYLACTKIGQI